MYAVKEREHVEPPVVQRKGLAVVEVRPVRTRRHCQVYRCSHQAEVRITSAVAVQGEGSPPVRIAGLRCYEHAEAALTAPLATLLGYRSVAAERD